MWPLYRGKRHLVERVGLNYRSLDVILSTSVDAGGATLCVAC